MKCKNQEGHMRFEETNTKLLPTTFFFYYLNALGRLESRRWFFTWIFFLFLECSFLKCCLFYCYILVIGLYAFLDLGVVILFIFL